MVLDTIVNFFNFILNIIGGAWNLLYSIIVPRKKRNYKMMYKKRKMR